MIRSILLRALMITNRSVGGWGVVLTNSYTHLDQCQIYGGKRCGVRPPPLDF